VETATLLYGTPGRYMVMMMMMINVVKVAILTGLICFIDHKLLRRFLWIVLPSVSWRISESMSWPRKGN